MRVFDRCTSNNSSSTYILLLWISIYIFIWLVYYFFHDWISTCEYDYRHPNLCSSKSISSFLLFHVLLAAFRFRSLFWTKMNLQKILPFYLPLATHASEIAAKGDYCSMFEIILRLSRDGFSREKFGEPFGSLEGYLLRLLVWDWRISIQWHWPGLPYDVELSSSVCLIGDKNAAGVRPYDPSCCGPRVCCQFPYFLRLLLPFHWCDLMAYLDIISYI